MDELSPSEQKKKDELEYHRRRKIFEPLILTEGWKEYELITRAQMDSQVQNTLRPINPNVEGLNNVLMSEYHKGVVFGMQLCLSTVHVTIAQAKEIQLEEINRQTKDTDHASRRSVDDDGSELPDGARVTDLSGGDQ